MSGPGVFTVEYETPPLVLATTLTAAITAGTTRTATVASTAGVVATTSDQASSHFFILGVGLPGAEFRRVNTLTSTTLVANAADPAITNAHAIGEIVWVVNTTVFGRVGWLVCDWEQMTLTRRRRAPDEIQVVVSRSSGHKVSDFAAGRELAIKRDGAYWWLGFMGVPQAPGGEDASVINVRANNSAAAMVWDSGIKNTGGNTFTGKTNGGGLTTTNMVSSALDATGSHEEAIGVVVFAAGDRTIASGTALAAQAPFGKGNTNLEDLNVACDREGWEWRVGVSAAGNPTIRVGSTVAVDRTATIGLFSPGNCRIADYQQDDTRLVSRIFVWGKPPAAATTLTAQANSGTNSLSVASAAGLFIGDQLLVDAEAVSIQNISGLTITLVNNLVSTHNNGAPVVLVTGIYSPNFKAVDARYPVSHMHHQRVLGLRDDTLRVADDKLKFATTYVKAFDHVGERAVVVVEMSELARTILDAPVLPGDLVSLTSAWLPFEARPMRVEEITYAFDRHLGLLGLTLALGDPALDDLAVLEGKARAAQALVNTDKS